MRACVEKVDVLGWNRSYTQYTHQGVREVGWGVTTKISCFCENSNVLIIHFITHCFLLLDCFSVGIVYIPVQNVIILILTHNQKLCRKYVDLGTKGPKWLRLSPNQKN